MKVNLEKFKAKREAGRAHALALKTTERNARMAVLLTRRPAGARRGVVALAVDLVVRAAPKSPRLQNRALLDLARGKPCLLASPICNRDSMTTVACHGAGVARGKGLGYKVSDFWTVWGCSACNHYTDAYTHATAEQKADVFTRGYALQILAWRQIATEKPTSRDGKAARWALDRWEESQRNSHV